MEATNKIKTMVVVISSTGGAAQHQGGALGQYEYVEDRGYFVQTSTDMENELYQPKYLYPDENDEWWVGSTPGESRGCLYNPYPTPSKTLPASGWQYAHSKAWHDDPFLTVSPGPLPPLPSQNTVTATGAAAEKWPEWLGVFTRTERWWNGRPVFVNTQGRLLHHGADDYGWVIGCKLGGYKALSGSRAHHSPASERSWTYWTGSEWRPASITVTGFNSTQTQTQENL